MNNVPSNCCIQWNSFFHCVNHSCCVNNCSVQRFRYLIPRFYRWLRSSVYIERLHSPRSITIATKIVKREPPSFPHRATVCNHEIKFHPHTELQVPHSTENRDPIWFPAKKKNTTTAESIACTAETALLSIQLLRTITPLSSRTPARGIKKSSARRTWHSRQSSLPYSGSSGPAHNRAPAPAAAAAGKEARERERESSTGPEISRKRPRAIPPRTWEIDDYRGLPPLCIDPGGGDTDSRAGTTEFGIRICRRGRNWNRPGRAIRPGTGEKKYMYGDCYDAAFVGARELFVGKCRGERFRRCWELGACVRSSFSTLPRGIESWVSKICETCVSVYFGWFAFWVIVYVLIYAKNEVYSMSDVRKLIPGELLLEWLIRYRRMKKRITISFSPYYIDCMWDTMYK